MTHDLLTQMLFVDAIVGVGFPNAHVAEYAVRDGLATYTGDQHSENWAWNRTALELLDVFTLQDLYTGLKLHKVTHAH